MHAHEHAAYTATSTEPATQAPLLIGFQKITDARCLRMIAGVYGMRIRVSYAKRAASTARVLVIVRRDCERRRHLRRERDRRVATQGWHKQDQQAS